MGTACCWPGGGTATPARCRSTGAGHPARSRCPRLTAIAVARWRIEEDHQLTKQATGPDAGQVIRRKSWHRWTVICLLAYIYLAIAVAVQRRREAGSTWTPG